MALVLGLGLEVGAAMVAGLTVVAGTAAVGHAAALAAQDGPTATTRPHTIIEVRPGIDVLLSDSLELVRGLRVGLITNPTGVDAAGRSTIDRLLAEPQIELSRLFAPEHGLRASVGEGQRIEDGVDPISSLPVISLYDGTKRAPEAADLAGLDALLFDMQDVGARYYTYVYTMALSMQSASEAGIPFIVLDRPNPINGTQVQGNVLDPAFASFVGLYPVPMRHGMTPGELARLFQGEFGIDVMLHVVPVFGWTRSDGFARTKLPWVRPSPNMPDVESALHYPGLCLFEGTNLSVGRGTDRPFQQIGAPWLDAEELARGLEAQGLAGVRFEPVHFTPREPTDGKFAEQQVAGVRAIAIDPEVYDPTRAALAMLEASRAQSGPRWQWNAPHFDRLAGTDRLRTELERGVPARDIFASWSDERAAFMVVRDRYLIY